MMKKILFILLLLSTLSVSATHMRSAEIIYKWLSGTIYEISVITYTEGPSSPSDRCYQMIVFSTGDTVKACRSNYEPGDPTLDPWGASASCDSTICTTHHMGQWSMFNSCLGIKKSVYSATYTFPGPGTFVVSFRDANRAHDVVNIPAQTPLYISATLIISSAISHQSSPAYINPTLDTAQVGICHTYNPMAIDPDGDSLSYQLISCMDSANHPITGYFIPTGVSLNSATGDLSWCSPPAISSPTGTDRYNFAINIKKWRKIYNNYTLIGTTMRDIQVLVGACAGMAVNEIKEELNIAIAPNPFSSSTTLQTERTMNNAVLIVYNHFGQVVREIKNISGQTITLSREDLPGGLHFVKLMENDRVLATGKLAITHK